MTIFEQNPPKPTINVHVATISAYTQTSIVDIFQWRGQVT